MLPSGGQRDVAHKPAKSRLKVKFVVPSTGSGAFPSAPVGLTSPADWEPDRGVTDLRSAVLRTKAGVFPYFRYADFFQYRSV